MRLNLIFCSLYDLAMKFGGLRVDWFGVERGIFTVIILGVLVPCEKQKLNYYGLEV